MLKQHSIFIAVFGQSDECLRTQVKLSILLIFTHSAVQIKITRLALEVFVPKPYLLMANKCTRQVALDFLGSLQTTCC